MTSPPSSTSQREQRIALIAVIVGALLMGAKFFAYYLTRSTVIFSDAMESIANVLASAVAYYALRKAHTPADTDHPYGHGKAEFLSAGFEGGVICVAALLVLAKSVDQAFFQPHTITQLNWGAILIAVTVVVNGGLGWWLYREGKSSGSMTLLADGKHLMGDALTSAGVLLAMGLVLMTKLAWLDPLLAGCFGLYILYQGWGLVRTALGGLTDEQDEKDHAMMVALLDAHSCIKGDKGDKGAAASAGTSPPAFPASLAPPPICSYHKVRHRHSGRYHWVDLHIRVPHTMNVAQAHDVASAIEEEIETALGEGNATAHVEPCAIAHCPVCAAFMSASGSPG